MKLFLSSSWQAIIIALTAALVLAAFVNTQTAIFTIFFFVLAWWVWSSPIHSFFLLLVIAPLLPMLKITQTIGTITLIKDVIISVLFWQFFLSPLLTKRLGYLRHRMILPLLTLLAWLLISLVRADSFLAGILRTREIVLYIMLYLAVLYLPLKEKHYRQALALFLTSAALVLVLGLYQWFFAADASVLRFDPVRSIWIPRMASILAHPSVFGHYLGVIATLLAGFCFSAARSSTRIWSGISLVLVVPFIYLTYSRAVWLGLAVALPVLTIVWLLQHSTFTWSSKQIRKYALLSFIICLAIMSIAYRTTPLGTFVRTALDPTYASNEERIIFAVRLIAPLTNTEAIIGRGLGDVITQNFRAIDLQAIDLVTGADQSVRRAKDITLVDNQYLKTFIELGLVGLIIYGVIFYHVLSNSWQLLRLSNTAINPGRAAVIAFCGLGFFIFFIIQGFFIDVWDIFPTNAAFWIIAGLVTRELANRKFIR